MTRLGFLMSDDLWVTFTCPTPPACACARNPQIPSLVVHITLTDNLIAALPPASLGLDGVLVRTAPELEHALAEPLAPMLAALVKSGNYTHLAAAHSALGKNVFPRVAGLLQVQQVGRQAGRRQTHWLGRPPFLPPSSGH